MAWRANYWSCSTFADWLRGTMKPTAETSEGWSSWKKQAKKDHPYRYWLAEEGLDLIQNTINWPTDKLNDFSYWCYNRFLQPTHTINTRLTKGQWHETDTKLLHGMFEELVDFVEIQKACMNHPKKDDPDYKFVPWWDKHLPYFFNKLFTTRSQHLGVRYLLWETALKQDESWFGIWDDCPEDKRNEIIAEAGGRWMKPTYQAEKAQTILDLYVWWKFIRPMRIEPMERSGWSAYCDAKRETRDEDDIFCSPKDPEERAHSRHLCDLTSQYEQEYDDEDEQMMIQLIKVRKSLWT